MGDWNEEIDEDIFSNKSSSTSNKSEDEILTDSIALISNYGINPGYMDDFYTSKKFANEEVFTEKGNLRKIFFQFVLEKSSKSELNQIKRPKIPNNLKPLLDKKIHAGEMEAKPEEKLNPLGETWEVEYVHHGSCMLGCGRTELISKHNGTCVVCDDIMTAKAYDNKIKTLSSDQKVSRVLKQIEEGEMEDPEEAKESLVKQYIEKNAELFRLKEEIQEKLSKKTIYAQSLLERLAWLYTFMTENMTFGDNYAPDPDEIDCVRQIKELIE